MDGFDWKHPDYEAVFRQRLETLDRIRAEPEDQRKETIRQLKLYYRDHPVDFINDWGITFEPRNIEIGLPPLVPFLLYPRQVEWIEFILRKWRARQPGITEKSREIGVSWTAIALSCTLCLHYEGMSIGFGSRLVEYVDQIGEPKSLFEKARIFMDALPVEFRGGWRRDRDAPHKRIKFPETGSIMGGEGGDEIGRGDRRAIYFVDEAAHLEHPELVDAALSMTTNCRQDVSSVKGRANPFAEKRFSGAIEVFTFHWRDDPRKDQQWYERKSGELNNPVIVAQELDIDYSASVEGVVIPQAWVQAAIDANGVLMFGPTGAKFGALDVADEGMDLNAFCGAHGVVIQEVEEWSGKGSDLYETTSHAFDLCDGYGTTQLRYDADGLGAGIRGDAKVLNTLRGSRPTIRLEPFRGSAEVVDPEREDVTGRKNQDYFANLKAQQWWSLRTRFYKTWRAITELRNGVDRSVLAARYPTDSLISIRPGLKFLSKLCVELSQPTYRLNEAGKIVIEKTPSHLVSGTRRKSARSPNLADSVMIRFAAMPRRMIITDDIIKRAQGHGVR